MIINDGEPFLLCVFRNDVKNMRGMEGQSLGHAYVFHAFLKNIAFLICSFVVRQKISLNKLRHKKSPSINKLKYNRKNFLGVVVGVGRDEEIFLQNIFSLHVFC